jgi:hypothetical protein
MTVGYYRLPSWAHEHQNTAECPIVDKTLVKSIVLYYTVTKFYKALFLYNRGSILIFFGILVLTTT